MAETVTDSPAALESLSSLRDAKAFIFDMDGVLYRGKTPLPGVEDVFNALTLRGIPFLLATNNSMATPASYVLRMAGMGVECLLYTSPSPRDGLLSRMPSSA